MSKYDVLYLGTLAICLLIRVLIGFKRCYDRAAIRNGRSNAEDVPRRITSLSPSTMREIQNPEERREKVLTSIIIKKAVLSESTDSQTSLPQNDEETGFVADPVDSKTSRSSKDVKEKKSRSSNDTKEHFNSSGVPQVVKENFNSDGVEDEQKGNILIDTIRSISLSVSEGIRNLGNVPSDSSAPLVDEYSAKSCPICLEIYTAGEEICWSHNDKCVHGFHLDCMVAWLMKSNDCPLCREPYLNSGLPAV